MTSRDTTKHISSQELEAGPSHSGWPDGQADMFGQEAVRVSRSQQRLEGLAREQTMSAIYGPSGSGLSLQDRLNGSLVSRLPLPALGLIASAMTWKQSVTPSGRRFFRLSVSAKTISDIGFTLRATPTATANQDAPSMMKHKGCRGIEVTPKSWCERMGYPLEWLYEGLAMPSSRKSRQSL
jgi:hypothetical protein